MAGLRGNDTGPPAVIVVTVVGAKLKLSSWGLVFSAPFPLRLLECSSTGNPRDADLLLGSFCERSSVFEKLLIRSRAALRVFLALNPWPQFSRLDALAPGGLWKEVLWASTWLALPNSLMVGSPAKLSQRVDLPEINRLDSCS